MNSDSGSSGISLTSCVLLPPPPNEVIKFVTLLNPVSNILSFFYAIVGSRISFKLQKHWFPNSLKLSEKHITQKTVYDNYAWYKKDKSVHRRSERKDYFPIVLDKKYVNLPNISIIGENMQMTDTDENGDIYSFFVHSKNLTDSFVKLMQVVRDTGKVPEGFRKVPDE